MLKTSSFKIRMAPESLKQWRLKSDDRHMSLAAFVVESVDAAIVGKVDQASLDSHLRQLRRLVNSAMEATTLDETRMWLSLAKAQITEIRGM